MSPLSNSINTLVYPVFRHALRLKERLRLGRFDMVQEQTELKRLLKNAEAAGPPEPPTSSPSRYLGVGYPLACWLDEIFILDPTSPWKDEWRENTLEAALYDSRARAYRFWEQAEQAEARSDSTALEVFYLCMMLGFRGNLREEAIGRKESRERLESHLLLSPSDAWPDKPLEKPIPPPAVPPLQGREQLRWLLLAFAVVFAGAIVTLAYAAMKYQIVNN